jgi:hypothetical protein
MALRRRVALAVEVALLAQTATAVMRLWRPIRWVAPLTTTQ